MERNVISPPDWNAEAKRAASYFADNHFRAHRGAAPWQTLGVCVIFGNDDYAGDDRTKAEVAHVRAALKTTGTTELGFGVDDDKEGYTWAMIVQTEKCEDLVNLVWEGWREANGGEPPDGFEAVQRGQALPAIMDKGNAPTASIN